MTNNIELHPLCTLFPRLSGNEFESLCADIRENGLRSPIVMHDGMILDGGNRYRACIEAGVDPVFEKFNGGNLVSFVLSVNLHRRHMTPGQQAAIVASAQDWSKAHERGGDRKSDQSATLHFDTSADRAAQSGASLRTQKNADKVAKADPELAKQVAHGKISLPKAIKSITPKKPNTEENNEEYDEKEQTILELKDTIVSLDEENTRLKDAIASGQLPEEEIQSAAQIIAELRSQVRALDAELSAVKSSRDGLLVKVSELEKQCKYYASKLKKYGQAQ